MLIIIVLLTFQSVTLTHASMGELVLLMKWTIIVSVPNVSMDHVVQPSFRVVEGQSSQQHQHQHHHQQQHPRQQPHKGNVDSVNGELTANVSTINF